MEKLVFNIQTFSDLVAKSDCDLSLSEILMNLERKLIDVYVWPNSETNKSLARKLSQVLDLNDIDRKILSYRVFTDFNGKLHSDVKNSNLYLCMMDCCEVDFIETLYLNLAKVYDGYDPNSIHTHLLISIAKSLNLPVYDVLALSVFLKKSGIKPYN